MNEPKIVKIDGKEYWAGLLNREGRPLTKDESYLFIKLTMIEMKDLASFTEDIEKVVAGQFLWEIFKKRIEHVKGLNITSPLAVFIVGLCDRPAKIVMWAYTLNLIKHLDKLERVSIDNWVMYFPMGIPTEEVMEAAWLEQKVKPMDGELNDNLVDDFRYWPR